MPELPEVETIAMGLHKRVAGDRIETVWIGRKPEPLKSRPAEIARALEGARIERVRRVGKHIVFDLNGNSAEAAVQGSRDLQGALVSRIEVEWIVHLGMTGRMVVADPALEPAKHTHLVARLDSGRELRFIDPRRFGRLEVRREEFKGPGAEPLTITVEDFARLFHRSKAPIKAALLNQKLLAGVGNIYADESLFRAGIRPRRRAHTLTRDELNKLHAGVQQVLKEAIAAGGSSVSDYVDAGGEEGFFQLQHRAYGREGEPCLVCQTPIKKIVVAGRGTHYCPRCQK
ncbi:MAG TPA: bifunctional DNA-formamidopyrimidine glycosylase/DNA-(apurinic or apyrimidinic site) lyase [Candidatus Angelobacter sp.]